MKVTVLIFIFLYGLKRELQFWAGAPKTVIRISNLAKFTSTPPPSGYACNLILVLLCLNNVISISLIKTFSYCGSIFAH